MAVATRPLKSSTHSSRGRRFLKMGVLEWLAWLLLIGLTVIFLLPLAWMISTSLLTRLF